VLAYQVLLDKRGYSPGQIDGRAGDNLSRAIRAFQEQSQLPATGSPDCDTWTVLAGGGAPDVTTQYEIAHADVDAPLTPRIPGDLVAQSKLPSLQYTSVEERLAEKFHASPALLASLNRGVRFAATHTITVPAVEPFDVDAKPKTAADGSTRLSARVSSGSEHDPLPIGTWRVTGVSWMPPFHYSPELFWDAEPSQSKATIKPGPNGPVGVVWIDVNVPHYGLHGTPEPGRVGHTQSHGCVRLTNWDAARLVAMVGPGTTVVFKE
jgi:lipoprotein-anchoring transpeptidase ErfK/SrfK